MGLIRRIPWRWVIVAVLVLFLILWIGSCISDSFSSNDEEEAQEEVIQEKAPESPTPKQETKERKKILRFDGFTPCEPRIDYVFSLESSGAITMNFPNVPVPVEYSGKGHLDAPKDRKSGPVPITSQDPTEKIRIQIWEIQ